MRFIQKYTLFGIMLLMSLLLDYGVFFQNNDASFVSELSSESNTTTSFSSDTQICEDDQLFHKTKMLMFFDNNFQHNIFQEFSRLPHPSFTVWQPPKTC